MRWSTMRKTTFSFVILSILTYLSILSMLIFLGNSVANKALDNTKEALIKDNETVINNIKHLYDFDVRTVDYVKKAVKDVNNLTHKINDEMILNVISNNYRLANTSHDNVIYDIKAIYNDKVISAANNNMYDLSSEYKSYWFNTAFNSNGEVVESMPYDDMFSDHKLFSYCSYDYELNIAYSVDIDVEKLHNYDKKFSIESCDLYFINKDGIIISAYEKELIGKKYYDVNNSKLNELKENIDYVNNNPDTSLYDMKEEDTFTFTHYYSDAKRYIVTVYYPSKAVAVHNLALIIICGVVLLIFGALMGVILVRLINKNKRLDRIAAKAEAQKEQIEKLYSIMNNIIEYRSYESGSHIKRVQKYTEIFARKMAINYPEYELDDEKIENIALASSLHDIGKVGISDTILNKPGRLTSEEYEEMKKHSAIGAEMIEKIFDEKEEYYTYSKNIALHHHERYDGKGYPHNLEGDKIPIEAQIVSIVDVLDALTNKRCYKPAETFDRALEMIFNNECGCFNPKLLNVLRNYKNDIYQIYLENKDDE